MNRTLLTAALVTGLSLAAAQGTTSPSTTTPGTASTGASQGAWRGLNVPAYPGATNLSVSSDDDEYELYFQSRDSLQQVFNFYRDFLVRQGFRVASSESKDGGTDLKANLTRGQGAANNIELDVKLKNGQYKVEIEFGG